ncbi:DUF3524 domain-containing protein [Spongiibacter sp. KMU-158]|uniref:tRNA-queuosine alpha-mannosyltransferase n=1 Tax=Spongiibacter pelagi TaxID=2760804 RepID=A0A927C2E5_9GAMM|nr:DUF3524 domain-containing protein [Spongiibacter pelagi]MBD2858597.1 DUF3524 domain-containing protein [Spongiibacter pelagi]
MRVLLLSAYHAQSHALWAQGLQQSLPDYSWTELHLAPRYFNWRLRGNSLSWAFENRDILSQDYDLLIATSMCDLTGLRSFIPSLSRIPNILYCHENQFAYPESSQQQGRLENQMTTLYSALSADCVIFNSHYNRESFIQGVTALLKKMPDHAPFEKVNEQLQNSCVIPVGVAGAGLSPSKRMAGEQLSVLWNHRWEYDKGPDTLLSIVEACDRTGLAVDFSIVGQQFRNQPPAFSKIHQVISSSSSLRLKDWGFVEKPQAYLQLLSACDVVLSTALHDFQGLSVLEAVAHGCTPVLPNHLVYPEWFDSEYFYQHDGGAEAVLEMLLLRLQDKQGGDLPQPDVARFAWPVLAPLYKACIDNVLSRFVNCSVQDGRVS